MSKRKQIDISAPDISLKKRSFKEMLFEQKFIILAFFVPFLIMGIAFAVHEVFPFGDKQILVTDFWQQYYPFFCNFHEKLREGSSMLWSWGAGLGTNYIALIAYYLASPLNLLLFFVPAEFLREALTVSLMIKVGCSGVFTAMFLRTVFKRNDFSVVFFSMLFALSAFTMGYYWNIIWFDAFALMPLVTLGTYCLLVQGKYKTYVVALALAMLTNYYIGFFICIFTVIAFIAIMVISMPGWKVVFQKLVTIGIFTVIALGIASIFMFPAVFALQNTHGIENTIPKFTEIYEWKYDGNLLQYVSDILGNLVAFTKPTDKEGLPNIYCGFICVLLSAFYFRCKNISFREKVVSVVVLLLFLYCCVYKLPNFIIHGFHLPNMLPYRFSFLISFVLIVMAYRAFLLIDKVDFGDIFVMGVTGTVFILFAYVGPQTINPTDQTTNTTAVVGTIAVTVVYLGLLALRSVNLMPKQVLSVGIFVVMLVEIFAGAIIGVKTVRVTSRDGYPDQNEPIQELKANIDKNETDEFYRMEMQAYYTINDASIYGYNGVSLFSSTVNESITNFVNGMGMIGWDAGNRYYYSETSPLTNSFLNIKYLLARRTEAADTVNWTLLDQKNGASSYKHNNPLPFGFMANSDIKTFDYNYDVSGVEVQSPFDAQNSLFIKSTGINENIFTPLTASPTSSSDQFNVSINSNTKYTCNAATQGGTFTAKYTVTKDNTPIYAYTSCEGCTDNKITITAGTKTATTYEVRFPYIISLGVFNKGDLITVSVPYAQGTSGNCNMWVCELNQELYEKGINTLKDEGYEISEFEASSITGKITANQDGTMYTSIPYESGWKAYVDGEEVEITPIADNALVTIDLKAGTHNVTFKYSPKGFAGCATVCVVCLLMFVALIVYESFYLKKKKNRTLLTPLTNSALDELTLTIDDVNNAQKKQKQQKQQAPKKK
ncbi:MAG: YfhO family protein [Acutalibacteraceae bacterium]|nr:YfhO family protein [Acutalibacteraceae bacterium]